MRFRIIELLIVVAVVAFAMVALQRATPLLETLFFSFTLLVILVAMLMAIARQAGARAFWLGFALTASLYLALVHRPPWDAPVPRHDGPEITTQILRELYNRLHDDIYDSHFQAQPGSGVFSLQDEPDPAADGGQPPAHSAAADPFAEMDDRRTAPGAPPIPGVSFAIVGGSRFIPFGHSAAFMRIGHSAWALLLGWLAGHFTRFVYERTRRKAAG